MRGTSTFIFLGIGQEYLLPSCILAISLVTLLLSTAGLFLRLKVDQDWDEEQVERALAPDQSGWLPLWVHAAGGSFKRALARMQYDGPPEMAACFACMAADNDLEQYSVEELEGAVKDARLARKQFLKKNCEYGFYP